MKERNITEHNFFLGTDGIKIVELEEQNFGINHAVLGAWLIKKIGLDKEYYEAAYFHEFFFDDCKIDGYPKIVNMAKKYIISLTNRAKVRSKE